MPLNEVGTPSPAVAADDGPSLDIISVSQTLLDNLDLPANRVCMVCFDGAEYATNPLLCCSVPTCRMRVHLACYGSGTDSMPLMPYKKRSKWVCDVCTLEKKHATELTPNSARVCVVCKMSGGVVKPTKADNTVCHLVCVRWLPELKQVPSEVQATSSVVDADLLFGTRKSLKCHICHKRNGCLQCMSKRCTKAFHAVCALRALESKVYTGVTEANHLACICDSHFADVRATYRSIKDVFWDQPYLGTEVDLEEDDEPTAAAPSQPPAPHAALSPSDLALPPLLNPVIPFSQPPTPNKVGRPRKHPVPQQDPSVPKPTLPPPPGSAANTAHPSVNPRPFMASPSSVGRPRPPQQHAAPSQPSLPQLADVAVCTWCMQPMLSSILHVHQASLCPLKPASSRKPKDPNLPKRPRGRPPGSNSKANKDTQRPPQPKTSSAATTKKSPSPKPLQPPTVGGGVAVGPSPRPMLMLPQHHPRPMAPTFSQSAPPPPASPIKDILMENALGVLRHNAVDSLFSSWPGMPGGGLLQSRDFWTQVFQSFFTKPSLLPAKWTPLTQWLAGVNSQAFLTPLKPPPKCSDATTFAHVTNEWLAATHVRHTCDAMLQSNGLRCVQPLKPFTHIKSMTRTTESSGILEVVLASHDHRPVQHCRFAVVCSANAPTTAHGEDDDTTTPGASNVVWSRFRPNKTLVTLPTDSSTSSMPTEPVWVSLLSIDEVTDVNASHVYTSDTSSVQVTEAPIQDDMALEALLCYDVLQETLKGNRMRWRTLWRKAAAATASEAATAAAAKQVESLYEEYNWWKSVCTSVIKGTTDMPFLDDVDGNVTTELQSFEDGTCVICMDGTSEESNPIIFCDKCDVAVHQRCYGVATIPKSDFFCNKCSVKGVVAPQCALCPHPHGALKQTVEGHWVHVFCGLWCPTTFVVKVPRMLFQLSQDDSKVRYATSSFQDNSTTISTTTALANVEGIPPALQRGGLCRVCRIATGCTVQCRHCPGLRFTLTCKEHTPPDLPCQDRELQRRQRAQLYTPTTRARCAVCFVTMNSMHPHHRFDDSLPTTHFFLRCTDCHVQCHAHCVHPVAKVDPHAQVVTWQCEKCRLLPPGSITSLAVKPAAVTCLLCDQPQGYMLPAKVHASEATAPSPTAAAAAGLTALSAPPPPVVAAPTSPSLHVHLYCAKAFHQPIQKSGKGGRVVTVSTPSSGTASQKCQCSVSFHPYCAATALYFSWKPTPKAKMAYACSEHPPDFAAFDAENQVWITRDTLLALQEIRCSLERVRMFIDLSKQREKIKKRLFVQSDCNAYEKAVPLLHVTAPTTTMKEFYHTITNDQLVDIPKKRKIIVIDKQVPHAPTKKARKDKTTPPEDTKRRQKRRWDSPQRRRHSRRLDPDDDDEEAQQDVRAALLASIWSHAIVATDHDTMDDVMAKLYPHHCLAEHAL
ncbi:hypothetical protein DYB31_000063 [Aphanomyces astaci]|uniref:PHD-type domain-containing protein n=2 Tax=Aphanomyces astaci TaxID=112090 RepID=A0A397EY23_APHAT|nr:hypothetical protein DYB31_000063 [Aphanomyces astaci]